MGTTGGAFYANYAYNWDQWYHAAVVMSPWDETTGSNGITVYINGEMESTDSTLNDDPFGPVPGTLVIGRRGVDWDAFYSNLIMDEITIFDTEIPAEDIRRIYQMSAPTM